MINQSISIHNMKKISEIILVEYLLTWWGTKKLTHFEFLTVSDARQLKNSVSLCYSGWKGWGRRNGVGVKDEIKGSKSHTHTLDTPADQWKFFVVIKFQLVQFLQIMNPNESWLSKLIRKFLLKNSHTYTHTHSHFYCCWQRIVCWL